MFEGFKDYEDSKEQIKYANYLKGKSLLDSKDYDNGIKTLSKVANYKDSGDLINQAKYAWGLQEYDAGQYLKAISHLKEVEGRGERCCGKTSRSAIQVWY